MRLLYNANKVFNGKIFVEFSSVAEAENMLKEQPKVEGGNINYRYFYFPFSMICFL
jgi:hypothetical protein